MSLPWAGYRPLRPGRIHVWCPRCHRKLSNAPRGKYDPLRAVLVHTHCERCGQGGKECSETFLDAKGRAISWTEIERNIERVVDSAAPDGPEEAR